MIIIEREMYKIFAEILKRESEVWKQNFNGWMKKNYWWIYIEHNIDYQFD